MTTQSTTLRNTYTGNAATTVFAYQFRILDEDEVRVTVDDVVQTISSDYTVSGVGNLNGGDITFTSAPASGASIVITANPAFTQDIDYNELDAFPAESHEEGLDRAVMRDLAIREETERAILSPQTLTLTSNTIAGTIDSTARALTITTSGPAATDLASLELADIDTLFTSLASGDLLSYDGTQWINANTFTGSYTFESTVVFEDVVDVTNVNAETSSGGALRTNGNTNCLTWGSGGSANVTLGGNMSAASTYKIVNLVDPTSDQDAATKKYVDDNGGLGFDQTWSDVSGSRALDTVYTNNTGKPIQVAVTVSLLSSSTTRFKIGGTTMSQTVTGSQTAFDYVYSFIIPDGQTYEVEDGGGTVSLDYWWELS